MKRLTIIFLMLSFFSAGATSWRLNNNPNVNADFSTFQAAHDAAAAGDTIYVEGNGNESHYGNITISKKLIIIGPGYFLNENDSTYANPIFARFLSIYIQPTAVGTEIYGLYVYTPDGNTNNLRIRASDVVISRNSFYLNGYNNILIDANVENVSITQNYTYEIKTSSNSIVANNILISNNYVNNSINLNNLSSAIISNNVIRAYISNVFYSQIKNNILYQEHGGDVLSVQNTGNYVANNLVAGGLVSGGNYGPGNFGNVDMSTVFVGYPTQGSYSTDGLWQLKADGPAIGAGEGGIDCGMFGGPLPYVLSGLPAIPRIYEAIVPTAGSTFTGLPVIIKAKSQN
ncbi:MAG: hypothetical protein V2I46_00655 [Bacteroides sp.]|jgi:hypothetical protein|nr:hypothetical protein [Bacteroides sp.]